jgi:WD40 repeat protein
VSRIPWYNHLAAKVLQISPSPEDDLVRDLNLHFVDLFAILLVYQMKSVCAFYRNQFSEFLRELTGWDNWAESLGMIFTAETALDCDMKVYFNSEIYSILRELRDKARREVRRLAQQDLRDIFHVDPKHEIEEIEGRRDHLIEGTWEWIRKRPEFRDFCDWDNVHSSRLLWITGTTGVGKTYLGIAIIRELELLRETSGGPCTSYFFIQGSSVDFDNPRAALRCLIWMLLREQPWLMSHYHETFDPAGREVLNNKETSFYTLRDIFRRIVRDPRLSKVYFILEGVDECSDSERHHRIELLDLIRSTLSTTLNIKWLVSSVGEPGIKSQLKKCEGFRRLDLDSEVDTMHDALHRYIGQKLKDLGKDKNYGLAVQTRIAEELEIKAEGNFLMASSIFDELQVCLSVDAERILRETPRSLNELYAQAMNRINKLSGSYPHYCRNVLAVMAIVQEPIHLEELSSLTELPVKDLEDVVWKCIVFLSVHKKMVSRKSQSTYEYISRDARNTIFPNGKGEVHSRITSKLLQSMSSILKRDIYNLKNPGIMIDDVVMPASDPLVPVRYACFHWIDHVTQIPSKTYSYNETAIDSFMRVDFLYWLEALSLMKHLPDGINQLSKLEKAIEGHIRDMQSTARSQGSSTSKAASTLLLLHDACYFTSYNRKLIERTPLQLYVSALVFCPMLSEMRKCYAGQMWFWISSPPEVADSWSSFFSMQVGHTKMVKSIAYSPDSTELASSSADHTIRIWDTGINATIRVLKGHTDTVNSVVYSCDSNWIVSASADRTVCIWEAKAARLVRQLPHYCFVNSAAISPDAKWVATGSSDGSVQIWDRVTGIWKWNLPESEPRASNCVTFSHNSQWVASASADSRVRIWKVSGSLLGIFEGHYDSVNSVSFSPCSTRIVTASADSKVRIWDRTSFQTLLTFHGHSACVNAAVFSPNSKLVASGGEDPINHPVVQVWDSENATVLWKFSGPIDAINSLAFSCDSGHIAAGSEDCSILIWDLTSGELSNEVERRTSPVRSIAFSMNDHPQYFATATAQSIVQLWCIRTGELLHSFKGHTDAVNSVSFSYDGLFLASGSADKSVRIWDLTTMEHKWTSSEHDDSVNNVAFSPDNNWLASASTDKSVRVWNIGQKDPMERILRGPKREVNSVAFSPDSCWIASGSSDHKIYVWDIMVAESAPTILSGHRGPVDAVAFWKNSEILVSASYDLHIHIWNRHQCEALHKIYLGTQLHHQPFLVRGSLLYTELGAIDLERSTLSKTVGWLGYSVSRNRERIKQDEKNVFWLPFEYQPAHSAVSWDRSTVVIGCASGKILVIGFDPNVRPFS